MPNRTEQEEREVERRVNAALDMVAKAIRTERNRCAKIVGDAANRARDSNRKKAAAELDLLARDIMEGT